jgi:N4-gp56 family major capsid protein
MVTSTQITTLSAYGANLMQGAWLDQTFVEALHAELVATPLGRMEVPAPNTSTTVRWQVHELGASLTAGVTAEGADPADVTYTTVTAEATLQEYSGGTTFSAMANRFLMSAAMAELIKEVGYACAVSIEDRTMVILQAATNTTDAGTSISAEDIRAGASALETNKAKKHPASPGGSYYCFIATPAAAYDLMGEGAPTWFQAKSSDYTGSLQTPFVGTPATASLYNVIVKTSTRIPTASSNDEMYMIAKDAFGAAYVGGPGGGSDFRSPQVHVTMPSENAAAKARNWGSVGYAVWYNAVIIDNNRLREIIADT